MATYSRPLNFSNGIAFANAIKVYTDLGDKLIDIQINPATSIAICTFEIGTGVSAQPAKASSPYSVKDGLAFAQALKVHTDANNGLVWIIANSATSVANCWFA